MKNYWEIKSKADKVGELLLYGDIASAETYGDEVTPTKIDAELKALGDLDTLNVYVNSGGGSIFAGIAIHNIIKRSRAVVKNAYVDGIAASVASLIPMACDNVFMPSNSMMMIHNPLMAAKGYASDLRKAADRLDKARMVVLEVYREKTGMTDEELIPMMDAETWMTAKEAIGFGFANELQAEVKIVASINDNLVNFGDVKIDTTSFRNFKPEIVETYREEPPQPVVDKPEEKPETPNLSAQNAEFHKLRLKLLGGQ